MQTLNQKRGDNFFVPITYKRQNDKAEKFNSHGSSATVL